MKMKLSLLTTNKLIKVGHHFMIQISGQYSLLLEMKIKEVFVETTHFACMIMLLLAIWTLPLLHWRVVTNMMKLFNYLIQVILCNNTINFVFYLLNNNYYYISSAR